MPQAGEGKKDTEKRSGTDEGEKKSVVTPANAIVNPHAVMILGFYTVVADTAMVAS